MSIPHLHLAISHAPLFAALIGFVILIIAVARRSPEMRWVAYGLFVAAALAGIPVFLSGEGSEEAIERLPGVSEGLIDAHAAAAKLSLIGIELLGVFSLIAFGLERVRQLVPAPLVAIVLLAGGIETAALGYTANLGGQIRHSEVRAVGAGTNPVGEKVDANGRGGAAESGQSDSDHD
jgi:hypothetical protein